MQSIDLGTAILRLLAALRAAVSRFELQRPLRAATKAAPEKELSRQARDPPQLRGHIDTDPEFEGVLMNHLAMPS